MKKTLICLMLVFVTVLSIGTVAFAEEQQVTVVLDGKILEFDQNPVIQNGRTLVPLRGIFEPMGAEVGWDDATQTVTAVKDDITIKLTIGDNILYKNGEAITLDVPAQLIGSRTMVPARAVSEAFDARVGWIEEIWMVTIVTDQELIAGIEKMEAYDKVIVKVKYALEIQGLEAQAVIELGRQKTGDKFSFRREKVTIPDLEVEYEKIVSTNGIWTYKKDVKGNRTRLDEATDLAVDTDLNALIMECNLAGFVEEVNGEKWYKSINNVVIVPMEDTMCLAARADTFGIGGVSGDEIVEVYVYEETGEALKAWYNSMVME